LIPLLASGLRPQYQGPYRLPNSGRQFRLHESPIRPRRGRFLFPDGDAESFKGVSPSSAICYLDDVLLLANSPKQMLERMKAVFDRFRAANLRQHHMTRTLYVFDRSSSTRNESSCCTRHTIYRLLYIVPSRDADIYIYITKQFIEPVAQHI